MRLVSCRLAGRALFLAVLLALYGALAPSVAWAGSNGHQAGKPCPPHGAASCGDPIVLPTGNHFEQATDFKGGGKNPLEVTRYFNSIDGSGSFANWSWTYDRSIFITPTEVDVTRADGKIIYFVPNGSGGWKGFKDLDLKLTQSGTTWTVTDWDDTVETYTEVGAGSFRSAALQSIRLRSGYTQTMHYDANQKIDSVTDSFGRTLAIAYNPSGYISSITAPDGLVITYSYTVINFLSVLSGVSYATTPATSLSYLYENLSVSTGTPPVTAIIDEKGERFASWTYDGAAGYARATSSQHAGGADLTQVVYNGFSGATVTGPLGQQEVYNCPYFIVSGAVTLPTCQQTSRLATPTTTAAARNFTYDSNGYLASETDWNGNLTQYVNDARGNETSRTEAAGTALARTITTIWSPTFHLPTQIAEPNRVKNFTYDADGNVLTASIVVGAKTRTMTFTYGAFGRMLTATDPRGNVTTFTYNATGDLATVTNALGQVTQYTNYDGAGRLLRMVDPNGVVTTLTYDKRGRMTSRTEGALTTQFTYDPVGNLTRVTSPDGSYLAFTYDAARRLTGIRDALNNRITYTLDAAGNVTKEIVTNAANVQTRKRYFAYDALSRRIKSTDALGNVSRFTYDAQDNLRSAADALAQKTSYVYDALERLTRIYDAEGGVTKRGYNANDNPTSVFDPRNLKTAYVWDGFDDERSVNSPDTGLTTKTYDLAGNLLTSTDARGQTTTYAYDALNRRISETFADTTSVAYEYDQGNFGIGRLTKITDPTGSTSYIYDANGHVKWKTQFIGALKRITGYTYDAGGRLASITYPSGAKVTYAYDAAGRVIGLTSGAQTLVSNVAYQPFGGVSGWTFGNGAAYSRAHDLVGRITGLSLPAGETMGLAYDVANRITGITNSVLPAKTFAYDALDRLTNYQGGALTQSYAYDAVGNRVSASLKNGAVTNAFSYAFAATSNRLTGISGAWNESFGYDAAGNTLTHTTPSGAYSFAYNARGRMAQGSVGATTKTYGVNGLGQRAAKSDASSKVIFGYDEGGRLIGEYKSNGGLIQETVWLGDLPIATLRTTGSFYVAPDHLGAPQQVTDAAQAVVWRWDRDPFGNGAPTQVGGFVYNLRFPGQYYDAETGLNYNYFRDYDPKIGRYVQSDPIGLNGGVNTYAYTGNPVNRVDPFGLQWANVQVPPGQTRPIPGTDYKVHNPTDPKQDTLILDPDGNVYKRLKPGEDFHEILPPKKPPCDKPKKKQSPLAPYANYPRSPFTHPRSPISPPPSPPASPPAAPGGNGGEPNGSDARTPNDNGGWGDAGYQADPASGF